MPNAANSTRSLSNSSACPTTGYDYILNESDAILNDLNEIIDSETNRKQKALRKNESFKIKSHNAANNNNNKNTSNSSLFSHQQLKDLKKSEFDVKMPKLKSYIIKSSLSQISGLGDESNASKIFHSNSHSINISPNCAHHATVSAGTKLSKKLLNNNANLLPASSPHSSGSSNRDHTSSATCIINNSKKKRSSLFNLFSFKNLSRDSSVSNSQTSIHNNHNSKSVNQSVINLAKSSANSANSKVATSESGEKFEKKKFNEFRFVALDQKMPHAEYTDSNTHYDNDECMSAECRLG